jgi:DNA repair protein REV1
MWQYGLRFDTNEQVEAFVYRLAGEVARRLDAIDMRGWSLTLKVMKRDPSATVEAPKVGMLLHAHNLMLIFSRQKLWAVPDIQ